MIKNAIYKIILLLCFPVLLSCNKDKATANSAQEVKEIANEASVKTDTVDLKKFEIGKAKLGPVTIGMTLSQADTLLMGFIKHETEARDFGFDGGSKAFIYKFNDKPILALVPARDNDTIIAIVAIDARLSGIQGVHPEMTIQEMLPFYPDVKMHLNTIMGWEEVIDDVYGWQYVFVTTKKTRVGDYKNQNQPALPKRMNARCEWIIIKAPKTNNDCSLLRDGTFTYKDSEGDDVLVKVNNNIWTEEHKGGKYVTLAEMKWLSKCEYENTLIMSSIPGFKLEPGTKMDVTIDKVSGFDIYFTATAAGKSYHGMLTKI